MKPKTVIAWHRTGFSSYWRWLSRSLSVTDFPSAPWVVQQLREAFSFDVAPRRLKYLLFDRDTVFSAEVIRTVASMALRPKRTSYRSPWQNGIAERLVGSGRRELLDHVIVLHEEHLRRLLSEYWACYKSASQCFTSVCG